MNIDLTTIFNALIALFAAIITYKVIPWIKAKTTNEQQIMLRAAVKTFVYAAEQIYGAGKGHLKMEYVANALAAKGYEVDRDMIEATIRENLLPLHMVLTDKDTPAEQEAE